MPYKSPCLVHPQPLHHSNKSNPKPKTKKKKRQKRGTCSYIQSNITPKTSDYHVGVANQYKEVQNLINVNQPQIKKPSINSQNNKLKNCYH